jgi:transcriptional regulator with XRE-family HTH domain
VQRTITEPQALGVAVRETRKSRALTQADLAKRAGVSRRFVQELEGGSRQGAELARVLAVLRALDRGVLLVETRAQSFDDVLSEVLG